jgi:hypothetical protein
MVRLWRWFCGRRDEVETLALRRAWVNAVVARPRGDMSTTPREGLRFR